MYGTALERKGKYITQRTVLKRVLTGRQIERERGRKVNQFVLRPIRYDSSCWRLIVQSTKDNYTLYKVISIGLPIRNDTDSNQMRSCDLALSVVVLLRISREIIAISGRQ